jgi:hypothetical protein
VLRKVITLVSAIVLLGVVISSAPADVADDQDQYAGRATAGVAFEMPEPATVALLGLGGLVLVPRRVRGR